MDFTIPYSIFLWLYVGAVGIVLLFSLSSLYHLVRFGFLTTTSVVMTFVLIAGTLLILFASYQTLSDFDWHQSLDLKALFIQLNPIATQP